ncbi:S41 family peptidase [Chitinimonas lacunae]|uniref:S41 family peptidase n=1 Tax=Chitinimonas lacunae TaxID=1963018 RepID=A0ABV8MTR4_9NEIS
MRKLLLAGVGMLALGVQAESGGPLADFDEFCRSVAEGYAYFDVKTTQWDKVCSHYRARLTPDADRRTLMRALEGALAELYDDHVQLGSSDAESPRPVPTGASLWAEWHDGRVMVREVRPGSAAEQAGLRAGMEVLAIDGIAVAEAVARHQPRFLRAPDPEAQRWALQTALAGRQNKQPMRLTVKDGETSRTLEYLPGFAKATEPLTATQLEKRFGYIRLHNSLGDNERTVKAFDQALEQLAGSEGLILDLRDTPSGGNSIVARGIMGRLVAGESPYQIHEQVWDERTSGIRRRWVEYVTPRGQRFAAPVVVLVGRWTGSMGEGLAIGLHGARGAAVVGTPMARLRGAIFNFTLEHSKLTVRIPTEKLFHIDGTPRESFIPCPAQAVAPDPALATALAMLQAPRPAQAGAKAGCAGELQPLKAGS